MKQRGAIRLALALGVLLGAVMTLKSHPPHDLPFGLWLVGSWVMNGLLVALVAWLALSLVSWAVAGFRG